MKINCTLRASLIYVVLKILDFHRQEHHKQFFSDTGELFSIPQYRNATFFIGAQHTKLIPGHCNNMFLVS